MPIIKADSGIITQINVFTVPDGEQKALVDYLARAARACRDVDGWLSASLHRSLDGTRVANYAQTVDLNTSKRVIDHMTRLGMIDGNKRFGEAHPGLYEVVFTLDR